MQRTADRAERMERRLELPVVVAAVLVLPLVVLQRETDAPFPTIVAALNWGTWLVFATEVVVMLIVSPDRRAWARAHPVEIAVTILTPPVLPDALAAARMLRLLRVIRLLRLAPILRRATSTGGVRYAAGLALVTLIGGGTAFAALERHTSTWTGLYWAVTTMTTVGYGDPAPQTAGGRIVAVVLMTVGVGFGTLLIGAVAQHFVDRSVGAELDETEDATLEVLREVRALAARLGTLEARLDAALGPPASGGEAPARDDGPARPPGGEGG